MTTTPTKKPKRNYLNNKDFLAAIVEYKARVEAADREGRQRPQIPRYAGECIKLICERMATRPNFYGYSYRCEMVQDAILNCIAAFDNFDPSKSENPNPFGYFSRIGWWAMLRRISDEKKENAIKHKNFQRMFSTNAHYEAPEGWVDPNFTSKSSETDRSGMFISGQIVEKYEETISKKKKAAAANNEPKMNPTFCP